MGKHASGPPPDPNDELREIFRVEPADGQSRRVGWTICAVAACAGVAAVALAEFTRGLLGPWRFLLVVPLGLCAAYYGMFAALFLVAGFSAKATAKDAPRRLRFVARHLGGGAVGLLVAGLVIADIVLMFPQPRSWLFYLSYCGAGFVCGVIAGVLRRRRRRARWRNAPPTPM